MYMIYIYDIYMYKILYMYIYNIFTYMSIFLQYIQAT